MRPFYYADGDRVMVEYHHTSVVAVCTDSHHADLIARTLNAHTEATESAEAKR